MAAREKATLEIVTSARDDTAKAFEQIRARTLRFAAQTSQVARRITSSFFSVRGAITSVGAALAAYAGARSFGGLIDELDELGKTSRRLNLPVDAFSELQFAAQLAGVTVEKFSTGMRFFQTRVVDAANGNKQLADVFRRLGVNLRESDGTLRSTEKLLEDLADAYVQFPEGAERSALAVKLFGEENSKLATLLEGSSSGLRDARAQGAFFVGSVGDGTKVAEEFNDALLRIQTALKSLFREGAIELADELVDTINALSVLIAQNREPLVEFFRSGGRAVAGFATTLIEATVSAAEFIREISFKASGEIPLFSSIEEETRKAQAAVDALRSKMRDFETTIATSGNNPIVISGLTPAMTELSKQIDVADEKLRRLSVGSQVRTDIGDLKARFADLVRDFESGFDPSASLGQFRALEDRVLHIQKLYREGFTVDQKVKPDLTLPSVLTGADAAQSEFSKQFEAERSFLARLAAQRLQLNEQFRTQEQAALEQDFALRFTTEEGYLEQLISLTRRHAVERATALRSSIESEIEELRRSAPAIVAERQEIEDQIVAIRRNGEAEIRNILAQSVVAEREAAEKIKAIKTEAPQDKNAGKSFWEGFSEGAREAGKEMTNAFDNGNQAAREVLGTLTSSASQGFASWVRGAQDGEDAFKSFLNTVLDGLAQIASEMLFRQLFGSIGLGIGSPAPSGGTTGLPSATGIGPSSGPTPLATPTSTPTSGSPFVTRTRPSMSGSSTTGGGLSINVNVAQSIQHPDGEAFSRAQAKQADQIAAIVARKVLERPEFAAQLRGRR